MRKSRRPRRFPPSRPKAPQKIPESPYDDSFLICVPCGRDFTPVQRHNPKGAEQCLKSLKPSDLPHVPPVGPAEAKAARDSRAARSNPNPRCTEAKRIWTWRKSSSLPLEVACASGGESRQQDELSPPSKSWALPHMALVPRSLSRGLPPALPQAQRSN